MAKQLLMDEMMLVVWEFWNGGIIEDEKYEALLAQYKMAASNLAGELTRITSTRCGQPSYEDGELMVPFYEGENGETDPTIAEQDPGGEWEFPTA